MNEEKENLCEVKFKCRSYGMNDCRHFTKQASNNRCKFENKFQNCTSVMAQVNQMKIEIKKLTV